jgi:methylated-DNA-[protein]-cysteine S-methyltransferase
MKTPDTIVKATTLSPLGPITLAATPKGLAGIWFDGQKHAPDLSEWPLQQDHPVLQQAIAALHAYFQGQEMKFSLPLDLSYGTDFQQGVWQALLTIKPGQTSTYSALSKTLGKPLAVRAVAAAIGKNPISILVPCHRVVGKDGSLVGYAGGLDRKAALLALEACNAPLLASGQAALATKAVAIAIA